MPMTNASDVQLLQLAKHIVLAIQSGELPVDGSVRSSQEAHMSPFLTPQAIQALRTPSVLFGPPPSLFLDPDGQSNKGSGQQAGRRAGAAVRQSTSRFKADAKVPTPSYMEPEPLFQIPVAVAPAEDPADQTPLLTALRSIHHQSALMSGHISNTVADSDSSSNAGGDEMELWGDDQGLVIGVAEDPNQHVSYTFPTAHSGNPQPSGQIATEFSVQSQTVPSALSLPSRYSAYTNDSYPTPKDLTPESPTSHKSLSPHHSTTSVTSAGLHSSAELGMLKQLSGQLAQALQLDLPDSTLQMLPQLVVKVAKEMHKAPDAPGAAPSQEGVAGLASGPAHLRNMSPPRLVLPDGACETPKNLPPGNLFFSPSAGGDDASPDSKRELPSSPGPLYSPLKTVKSVRRVRSPGAAKASSPRADLSPPKRSHKSVHWVLMNRSGAASPGPLQSPLKSVRSVRRVGGQSQGAENSPLKTAKSAKNIRASIQAAGSGGLGNVPASPSPHFSPLKTTRSVRRVGGHDPSSTSPPRRSAPSMSRFSMMQPPTALSVLRAELADRPSWASDSDDSEELLPLGSVPYETATSERTPSPECKDRTPWSPGPQSTRCLLREFDRAAVIASVQEDHWSPGGKLHTAHSNTTTRYTAGASDSLCGSPEESDADAQGFEAPASPTLSSPSPNHYYNTFRPEAATWPGNNSSPSAHQQGLPLPDGFLAALNPVFDGLRCSASNTAPTGAALARGASSSRLKFEPVAEVDESEIGNSPDKSLTNNRPPAQPAAAAAPGQLDFDARSSRHSLPGSAIMISAVEPPTLQVWRGGPKASANTPSGTARNLASMLTEDAEAVPQADQGVQSWLDAASDPVSPADGPSRGWIMPKPSQAQPEPALTFGQPDLSVANPAQPKPGPPAANAAGDEPAVTPLSATLLQQVDLMRGQINSLSSLMGRLCSSSASMTQSLGDLATPVASQAASPTPRDQLATTQTTNTSSGHTYCAGSESLKVELDSLRQQNQHLQDQQQRQQQSIEQLHLHVQLLTQQLQLQQLNRLQAQLAHSAGGASATSATGVQAGTPAAAEPDACQRTDGITGAAPLDVQADAVIAANVVQEVCPIHSTTTAGQAAGHPDTSPQAALDPPDAAGLTTQPSLDPHPVSPAASDTLLLSQASQAQTPDDSVPASPKVPMMWTGLLTHMRSPEPSSYMFAAGPASRYQAAQEPEPPVSFPASHDQAVPAASTAQPPPGLQAELSCRNLCDDAAPQDKPAASTRAGSLSPVNSEGIDDAEGLSPGQRSQGSPHFTERRPRRLFVDSEALAGSGPRSNNPGPVPQPAPSPKYGNVIHIPLSPIRVHPAGSSLSSYGPPAGPGSPARPYRVVGAPPCTPPRTQTGGITSPQVMASPGAAPPNNFNLNKHLNMVTGLLFGDDDDASDDGVTVPAVPQG